MNVADVATLPREQLVELAQRQARQVDRLLVSSGRWMRRCERAEAELRRLLQEQEGV